MKGLGGIYVGKTYLASKQFMLETTIHPREQVETSSASVTIADVVWLARYSNWHNQQL
jgi:hypothetical protein